MDNAARTLAKAPVVGRLAPYCAALIFLLTMSSGNSAAADDAPAAKYVFASYLVCCPRAGENVTEDDFLAEIRTAHEAGIDGFVLDCGEWNATPRYKRNTALLFQAAKRFGPDFKLFFAADRAGAPWGFNLSAEEAADMVMTYHEHPNYFRYQGRPVLNTFMGDADWFASIRSRIKQSSGEDVFLIPFFYPASGHEITDARDIADLVGRSAGIDGYFYFGSAGAPDDLASAIRGQAAEWQKHGKVFMAGIAPYYRGLRYNFRVFENEGYAGLAKQWLAAIQSGTPWVQLVTWNDWGEGTYFGPVDAVDAAVRWDDQWGYLLSHRGFLAADRYFIDWFKQGRQPDIQHEQVFYAFRLHRKYVPGPIEPLKSSIGWPLGVIDLKDQINIMSLLRSPAKLVVGTGALRKVFDLDAGMRQTSVPMQSGPVMLAVERNGAILGAKTAELPISVLDGWSDFNMLAGEIPMADVGPGRPQPH